MNSTSQSICTSCPRLLATQKMLYESESKIKKLNAKNANLTEDKKILIEEKKALEEQLAEKELLIEGYEQQFTELYKEISTAFEEKQWEKEKGIEWIQRLFGPSTNRIAVPASISGLNLSDQPENPASRPDNPEQKDHPVSGSPEKDGSDGGDADTEYPKLEELKKPVGKDTSLDHDPFIEKKKPRRDLLGSMICRTRQISYDLGSKFNPENMRKLGSKVYDELIFHPAWLEKVTHVVECAEITDQFTDEGRPVVIEAEHPKMLFEKCPASPSLLAHIICNKYMRYSPISRQADEFQSHENLISKQNMTNWTIYAYENYLSLINNRILEDQQKLADILGMDESWIKCLEVKKKLHKTKSTVIHSITGKNDPLQCGYFQFRTDKNKEFVTEVLGGSGEGKLLMADGNTSYKAEEVKANLGMCNDHAYRRFSMAVHVQPNYSDYISLCKEHGLDSREVSDFINRKENAWLKILLHIIGQYQKIYHVDNILGSEDVSIEEIGIRRQSEALPYFEEIKKICQTIQPHLTASSKLTEAVGYFLENYTWLTAYCYDGRLEINNCRAERGFRWLALLRKNSLFFKSIRGGEAGCGFLSIVETCKMNGIDPEKYIEWVLNILKDNTVSEDLLKRIMPYSSGLPEELKLVKMC